MNFKLKVSASIVTYNNIDKIDAAVSSILKYTTGVDFSLYISDNCSADSTVDFLSKKYKELKIIRNAENIGFGAAHNKVLPLIDSNFHCVINPDITICDDVITEMCEYMSKHTDVVMITPKILNSDGSEQHLQKRVPTVRYLLSGRLPFMKKARAEYTRSDERFLVPTEIDSCTGCFFIMRTDIFKRLGGFDGRFFMYFEDTDITLRAKNFGKVIFYPACSVIHLWQRDGAKKLKFLLIQIKSMFQFFNRKRKGAYKK